MSWDCLGTGQTGIYIYLSCPVVLLGNLDEREKSQMLIARIIGTGILLATFTFVVVRKRRGSRCNAS